MGGRSNENFVWSPSSREGAIHNVKLAYSGTFCQGQCAVINYNNSVYNNKMNPVRDRGRDMLIGNGCEK